MARLPLHSLDIRLLQYFAVTAEEGSLRKAAEKLLLSQPPLSLHIKTLEDRLGVTLFTRHAKGMALTEDGAAVLRLIRPLLELHEKTMERLENHAKQGDKPLTVGFTTGFEQGSFTEIGKRLRSLYPGGVGIVRDASRPLVLAMRKGKIDVALIGLPLLETEGLLIKRLPYAEARVLAPPAHWPEAARTDLPLKAFNGNPLLRLRKDHNPGFFEFTTKAFAQAGFSSLYIEEPMEHDVALALIASGEGMGLFPVSFTVIQREGVTYRPFIESNLLQCRLAIAALPENESLLDKVLSDIEPAIPRSRIFL